MSNRRPRIFFQTHPIKKITYEIQAHCPVHAEYWLFNDPNVAVRAMGKPGRRRWFEMQFVGPCVVDSIVKERQRHGNSIHMIEPFLKKNVYIHT